MLNCITYYCFLIGCAVYTQDRIKIYGLVKDLDTKNPITVFEVEIPQIDQKYPFKNDEGIYELEIPKEVNKIVVKSEGYKEAWINIEKEGSYDLFLHKIQDEFSLIDLTDEDLDENAESSNITGLFSALDDPYLNTVGFEYQGVHYNPRGLTSENRSFLLNGIHQDRLYDGKPSWNNWGGIDGIYRYQNTIEPQGISRKTLGKALGVNSLTTRSSKYRSGNRVSYARANRTYENKISVYSANNFLKNWFYLINLTKRWGDRAYKAGTPYNANSLMFSVEKFFDFKNSLNFSFLYTPNRRGLSGMYTDEVIALKKNKYNSYWGMQNQKERNFMVRYISEPIVILTHNYEDGVKIQWENSIMLQKGSIANSRLDYSSGMMNPDPAYYQRMPSYWLSKANPDYEMVYRYTRHFMKNGQLNWKELYESNRELADVGNESAYVLYDDKRDESRIELGSNFSKKINEKLEINGAINYRNTFSENYAQLTDLLGGTGYLDVNGFSLTQSDLNHKDRVVKEGDRFKYNYQLKTSSIRSFLQWIQKLKKIEWSMAISFSKNNHRRKGIYRYEGYEDSQGESKKINLYAFGGKASFLYKFSGKNLLDIKIAHFQKIPYSRKLFLNTRYTNQVLNLDTEKMSTSALTYVHRADKLNVHLTGYFNKEKDLTEMRSYFVKGIMSDSDDDDFGMERGFFVQEFLTDVEKRYSGIELGTSYKLNSSFDLYAVMGLGNYTYDKNPNLGLYTEGSPDEKKWKFTNGYKNFGPINIRGKKLSVGPQQAFSLIASYEDPDYWRIKVSVNHFRNNYVSIAPIRYTKDFLKGIDLSKMKEDEIKSIDLIRTQERLKQFTLINLSGSKSWKINSTYLSLFWSVQNVLNTSYITGGFSNSRFSHYTQQLEDAKREISLFRNRYFLGDGQTFFIGLYYSF